MTGRRCKNSSRATVERIGAVQTPVLRNGVVALLASASLLLSACSSGDGPAAGEEAPSPRSSPASAPASASPSADLPPAEGAVEVVKTLTDGLASPWGIAALPGGDLLVGSRDEATITRIDAESGGKTLLGSVPGVAPAGEGGLLGLAVAPTFGADHLVYAYFTTESDNRIARLQYDEKKPPVSSWGPRTPFCGASPRAPSTTADGSRSGPTGCCTRARERRGTRVSPRTRPPRGQDPADDARRRARARQSRG